VKQCDVIVVGAGVVGLSAARRLAERGGRVLVIESTRVGAEASSAAAGMLAPQAEAHTDSPLLPLALLARDRHLELAPILEDETGMALGLSRRGSIEVAFTDDDEATLRARLAWQGARGLPIEPLTAGEIHEAEPNLSPLARFGLYFAGDRRIDNAQLVRALAASAVAKGAAILVGRPVTGLALADGKVAGVRAGNETLHAPVVVNAMGAWAALLGGDPWPPAVEPVRGQIIAFDVAPPLLRHVVACPRGYLVPHADGRLVAGSTSERAGFDKSLTAAGMRYVLDVALEIAPSLADQRVANAWAGLRPATPDGLPFIGPGALPGLWHACGLFRNGILLGPLVGELVADLLSGVTPSLDLRPFSPSRFAPARTE
jgi:glycine oxidase